jgi:hypothetical protein
VKTFLAILMTIFSFVPQAGPSVDYSAATIGLISASGSGPYTPLTTTGSAGQSYDYSATTILLGYNSSTKKYYACGTANPCAGAGGGGTSGTINSGTAYYIPYYTANGTTLGPSQAYFDSTGNNITAGQITTNTSVTYGIDYSQQLRSGLTGQFTVDLNGNTKLASISSGVSTNTDLNGILTLSSGTASYTFTGTYTSAPVCVASDDTAIAAVKVSVTSTTLTVTGTTTDAVSYICSGRN